MAREFQRGHKAKISDLTAGTDLYVGVQITGPGLTFDISCFGLDADEQLSDDRYFVFFNQPKSPEESIQLLGAQAGDTESFRVTLDRIPPQIQKLSFTATIDGAGQMSQIAPGYVRIVAGGEEVARYSFDGGEFSTERAVMLGDFYLKDVWRFAAVGQGFDGGLDALLKNFGGEVAEEEPAAARAAGRRPVVRAAAQAAAPPAFGAPAGPAAPAPAPARSRRPGFRAAPAPRRRRPPRPRCTRRRPSSRPLTPPGGAPVPPSGARARALRAAGAGSRRTARPPARPHPCRPATDSRQAPRPARLRATASRLAPPGYGQQPPFGQVPGQPGGAAVRSRTECRRALPRAAPVSPRR